MYVISYIVAVVFSIITYTVVRVKVQEWFEDLGMKRLSLKRKHANNSIIEPDRTLSTEDEVYEISDDESEPSPVLTKAENIESKTNLSSCSSDDSFNGSKSEYPLHENNSPLHTNDNKISPNKSNLTANKVEKTRNGKNVFETSTDSLESDENSDVIVEKHLVKLPENIDNVKVPQQNTRDTALPKESKKRSPNNHVSTPHKSLFNWIKKVQNKMKDENAKGVENKNSVSVESDFCDDTPAANWKPKRYTRKPKIKAPNSEKNLKNEDNTENRNIEEKPGVELQIAGVKVKFPLTPYHSQLGVMANLITGCRKEQHSLLESPTGSGKTLALLCGALAWQEDYSAEVNKDLTKKLKEGAFDENGFLGDCSSSTKNAESCCENVDCEEKSKDCHFNLKVPKIYYGTRTHKQIEQVVKELNRTHYRYKRMTILSGREHTCIQESKKSKTELCNELLDPAKRLGCRYYNETNKRGITSFDALECGGMETPWDIEDMVSFGRNEGLCPYFVARNLMEEAEIIFCPYNYLIDPDIRESMQINLKGEVIILDEAHNIEDICRDAASTDFREDHLFVAAHECETLTAQRNDEMYRVIEVFLRKLHNFVKTAPLQTVNKSDNLSSPYWTGSQLIELFEMNNIGESTHPSFLAACRAAITDFNKAKDEIRLSIQKVPMATISHDTKVVLEHLIFGVNIITSKEYKNDYRACVMETLARDVKVQDNVWYNTSRKHERLRTLKFFCMNPAVIFAPLAKAARSIIVASGTLSPVDSFESELGANFKNKLNGKHVILNDQVHVRCIPKGPTGRTLKATYENVNKWDFQDELGRLLLEVCRSVPHGILCFFSSYNVMNTHMNRWRNEGCLRQIETIKQVFSEPRYSNDMVQTMNEYREIIAATSEKPVGQITGAVLLAVFRGKVAEGIDFSDNDARCVLAIGIPYSVRNEPSINMKMSYNDLNSNSKGLLRGSQWYDIQAFRALNQALGRCIRHKNDWGAVLLIDERFNLPTNMNYLPRWLKGVGIHHGGCKLREDLKQFVTKQIERQKQASN